MRSGIAGTAEHSGKCSEQRAHAKERRKIKEMFNRKDFADECTGGQHLTETRDGNRTVKEFF